MQRFQRLSIFLAALAALSTVFFVASAGAAPIFKYSTSFGSRGTGNGQFSGPSAVATDAAGNFWVADHEGDNVQKFNPKGEFLLKVTKGIYPIRPKDVAVDSAGNIWVTEPGGERVVEFSSTGTYIREFGEYGSGNGQFWHPEYIAIDSSGDLWVTDGANHRVQEFSSTGTYIRQFGSEGTGNGQFTNMSGIAVDAENNVWVADDQTGTTRIEEFNSSGAYVKQIGSGTLHETFEDVLSIHGGNLWVSDTYYSCVKVLNTNGEVLTQFGGVEVSEGEMIIPGSIVFDPSGNPWILVVSHAVIEGWVPPPPTVISRTASHVEPTEATLNARVNPEGGSTTYQFEYGTTTSYGSKVPASPASAGSGFATVTLNQVVSGLAPNTTYHYRVVATNGGGTSTGIDETFTTPSTIPRQLEEMAVENPFDGSTSSLSDFAAQWAAVGWATSGFPMGKDTLTGWSSVNAFPKVAGAYYSGNIVDTGQGIATVATLGSPPADVERYFSLWLDMSTPSGLKTGYELRLTETASASNTYTVTLSKWLSGVQTVLASKTNFVFAKGQAFALVDMGSTVSAWFKTGTEFTSLISATDSSFGGGQSGMEASGNNTRLTNFKTGAL